MKAEELMIGDYVNVTGKEGLHSVDILELLPRIGKVIGLDEEIVYVDYIDYAFSLGDVEPIPLTSDLLMQNGFEKDPETGECLLSDYDDTFEIYWIGTILTVQSGYGRMELVNCQYVHQLQHALRLCGIEKEIIIKED